METTNHESISDKVLIPLKIVLYLPMFALATAILGSFFLGVPLPSWVTTAMLPLGLTGGVLGMMFTKKDPETIGERIQHLFALIVLIGSMIGGASIIIAEFAKAVIEHG